MTIQKTMKCLLFCRVSSREQEEKGYSLEAQYELLKKYAEKKDHRVVKVFKISESASGKQVRKLFNKMIKYTKDKNINLILCEKIDRLTRNQKDAVSIGDWLEENEQREIHFVKENFIVNQNTKAHENLVWDMKVAIARFYTKNLSEEVKKGQAAKIKSGWYPKNPPLGYKTVGEKGRKTHEIDIEVAPQIKKMFELYSTGNYSLNKLLKIMHKEGLRSTTGRKMGLSMLHRYLREPFFYGRFKWNGKLYQGRHDAIINKELFDEVQEKLSGKNTSPHYKKHEWIFKKMITCGECGGTITWDSHKGHIYGHCNRYKNCSQKKYTRQEEVEKRLFPYFDKITPKSEKVVEWLKEALKESHAEEIEYNKAKRDSLGQIISRMDSRLEKIYDDKLDNLISPEFYQKKYNEYKKTKEDTIEELEKLHNNRSLYYEAGFAIHELALKAKAIYKSKKATIEEKRLLLSYIFSNHTLKDGILAPEYSLAFDFLATWIPKLNETFVLINLSEDKTKIGSLLPIHIALHGWRESDPR